MDFESELPVYTSPCGYFSDRKNNFVITSLDDFTKKEALEEFDYLLSCGFRRSGRFFYANVCSNCSRCIPIRIPVKDFIMTKKYRRILKINEDVIVENVDPEVNDEKIELFRKYSSIRHENPSDSNSDYENALLNLHYGYSNIYEMNYFVKDKLVAVGILDLAQNSTSTNYFYFDPEYSKRSLGVFSVLKEIEFTLQSGKEFYYLGFYIEESSKMRYKSQYQPAQLLISEEWIDFNKTDFTIYKSTT